MVAQLQAHGHVARGWLGVEIQSVTPEIASSLGIKEAKGAIVASVVPDGPAAKAGFEQGDIVTAINGKAVEDYRDLTRRVGSCCRRARPRPSPSTARASRRRSRSRSAPRPDDKVASNDAGQPGAAPAATGNAMGLGLAPLTPEARKTYNLGDNVITGVVITKVDPNSDAADKGLQPGDVVHEGRQPMRCTRPQDVQAGVAEAQKGGRKSVLLLVAQARAVRALSPSISAT